MQFLLESLTGSKNFERIKWASQHSRKWQTFQNLNHMKTLFCHNKRWKIACKITAFMSGIFFLITSLLQAIASSNYLDCCSCVSCCVRIAEGCKCAHTHAHTFLFFQMDTLNPCFLDFLQRVPKASDTKYNGFKKQCLLWTKKKKAKNENSFKILINRSLRTWWITFTIFVYLQQFQEIANSTTVCSCDEP